MSITVSAPGKLLLFGEHAVVYGHPCIVTAVDQRLRLHAVRTEEPELRLEAPDVSITGYRTSMDLVGTGDVTGAARFVEHAVRCFRDEYPFDGGVTLSTKSDFSSLVGFGSSSASVVCVIKALAELTGATVDNRRLFGLALAAVRAAQGQEASGFDVAAAVYGGTLYFVTGGSIIEPLESVRIPLLVGYTGTKADTSTMVSAVAKKRKDQPERVGRIFDAITKITDEARQRMREGDWKRVGKLMEFNQEYLRDLGVSTQKLEALIAAARGAGAWGAKLSGAGGGDCMLAVTADERREAVAHALTENGGQVIHIHTNADGVRTETDDQDELFIVVDEHDNVIGHKKRHECHHDPSLIHRAVELFIFDSKGRVLLQKRSRTKDIRAGFWSTSVGGHVGKGESYEDAMKREVTEELGIEIPVTYHSKRIVRFPAETEMEALFTATYDGPFTHNTDEVEEVRFFDKREVRFGYADKSLLLTEAAINNLKALDIL